MKATNIKWNGDYPGHTEGLPTEIEIPDGMTDEDEISDYISDATGFCHAGFYLVPSDGIENEAVKKTFCIDDTFGNEVEITATLFLYDVIDCLGRPMNSLGIQLYAQENGVFLPYATLTKTFGEYIAIKNAMYIDTNNCAFAPQLLSLGIAKDTGLTKAKGWCEYPLWIFSEEFLKEIGGEVYEQYSKEYELYYLERQDEPAEGQNDGNCSTCKEIKIMTKVNEISKKYGETTLRMALTHLFQIGILNLKDVDVEAACEQIKAETPDNYIMTPELRCDVMRCAVELAQEPVWDILSFIQTNIKIDGVAVHPGVIIEFRRNSDGKIISNCVLPADTGAETLDSVFELVDNEKEIYLGKHGSLYGFDYEGTINKALKGIGISRSSVEPDNVYYI